MKRLKKADHKHKVHSKKSGSKRFGLLRFSKIHMLLVVAAMSLVGGAYAISQSFAATPTYTTIVVTLKNSQTGGIIFGANTPGSTYNIGLMSNTGDKSACNVTSKNPGNWGFSCKVHTYTNGVIYSSYRVWFAGAPGYQTFNDPNGGSGYFAVSTNGTQYTDAYLAPIPAPAPAPAPAPQQQAPAPQQQAPAPQQQAPAPQPSSQPSVNRSSASTTVKRTQPVATNTNSSDTTPPSVPGSLTASEGSGGTIVLSWETSTDNKGVTGYIVERSTDGQNWTALGDSVAVAGYTDATTSFNTKYSYRVSAKDEAGNGSDYAVVDITTSAFEANAFADKETTIESEDKNVSVKIPEGALPEDAACKIETTQDGTLPEGQSLVAGVYVFTCKKKDGSTIDKYNKPLEFTVKATSVDQAKLAFQDGDQWQDSNEQYNGDVQGYTFSTDQPKNFAVLANDKKGTNWILLIFGIFLLFLAIFGLILWIIRRRQNQQELAGGYGLDYFDNYMQSADQQGVQSTQYPESQSLPVSAPAPSAAPSTVVAPTPSATPTPTESQEPLPEIKKMHEQPQAPAAPTSPPQAEVPQDDYATKQYPEQPYR